MELHASHEPMVRKAVAEWAAAQWGPRRGVNMASEPLQKARL